MGEVEVDMEGMIGLSKRLMSPVELTRDVLQRFRANTTGKENAGGNESNPNIPAIIASIGRTLSEFVDGGRQLAQGVNTAGAVIAAADRDSADRTDTTGEEIAGTSSPDEADR